MKKLLLIFVLLLFAGCGVRLIEGEVYQKTFTPAHSEEEMNFGPGFDGNPKFSTETVHYPDRWAVSFRRVNEETGEWDTRTVRVSEETYDRLQKGDWFEMK